MTPGDIGGTYGGNPVACAAGLAVLDLFDQEPLVERAAAIGARFLDRLRSLHAHERVGEVRGLGAMLAIELVEAGSFEPDPALADRFVAEARDRGVLVIRTGLRNNVIRLLPPLVLSDEEVDEAAEILVTALGAAAEGGS